MKFEIYNDEVDDEILSLLLTADPSSKSISQYLPESKLLVASKENETIGVAVVLHHKKIPELVNIAVKRDLRGKGIGKRLIEAAKDLARDMGKKNILVGTGNSSLSQLAFYQKNGFRIIGIETGFFCSYPEPIYENGIRCLDKIILSANI